MRGEAASLSLRPLATAEREVLLARRRRMRALSSFAEIPLNVASQARNGGCGVSRKGYSKPVHSFAILLSPRSQIQLAAIFSLSSAAPQGRCVQILAYNLAD